MFDIAKGSLRFGSLFLIEYFGRASPSPDFYHIFRHIVEKTRARVQFCRSGVNFALPLPSVLTAADTDSLSVSAGLLSPSLRYLEL